MTNKKNSVLIVDDDRGIQESLSLLVGGFGYEVFSAEMGLDAIEKVKNRFYNVVMIDIKLPDISGFEVLEKIKEINDDIAAIIMTGYGSLDVSIDAINKGAYTYIFKPFKADEVVTTIEKSLEKQKFMMENKQLKHELEEVNKKLSAINKILKGMDMKE